MTVIKKGYRVSVKTWENDADNYNSGEVEGLTRDEAAFIVDFVKQFASQNNWRGPKGIGNMYEPDDSEREEAVARIKAVVERHKATVLINNEFRMYFLDDDKEFHEYGWHEYAYELTLTGGEFWTRVMESYKVEYIPEDVHLQDVTKEFA